MADARVTRMHPLVSLAHVNVELGGRMEGVSMTLFPKVGARGTPDLSPMT